MADSGIATAERQQHARRALAWFTARPALTAALIYAVLSVVMVGQGLVPGRTFSSSDLLYANAPWKQERPDYVKGLGSNFELADAVVVFQPFHQYTRDRLPDLPLWNPHISGGRPYLANAQSAIFSPFSWPSYLLPFWWSLGVVAALKLFLGAFGAYVLGRALGMRFGGALLAGIVFAFGTFFIVWLSWPLTNIFPLLPWLFLLSELLVRRAAPLPAAGLAGLVALTYFGGHPETTFHALFATAVFFAFRLLLRAREERWEARALVRPVVTFGLSFAAGTAIAAVMLLPFYELLIHSGDLDRRQGEPSGFWPRKYLGALFLHDYWGRPTQQSDIDPFMQIRGWYAGGLTLMLAGAALILRPTATRVAVALFGIFAASMVVGTGPAFDLLTEYAPGFSSAHNQRMLIYCLFGLALLAGWGLDDLTGPEVAGRRRTLVLGFAALIFVVPLVWMTGAGTLTTNGLRKALEVAWGFADPPPVNPFDTHDAAVGDIVRMSSLLQWLPLAGAALLLVALRLRRARPLHAAVFVALAVSLLTVDLFRANMGFNPAIPEADAAMPETGAIRYLQRQRPNRFVGLSTQFSFQPLPPDMAMRFGLYDARGYDYPAEKHYDRMWRRNVAPGVPDFTQPIVLATATPAAVRALSLLSVTDFLQDPEEEPLKARGLELAYDEPDGRVYRNPAALPRVFLVGRQQTVPGDDDALRTVTAPGFDGREVAVTQTALAGIPQTGGGNPGSAELVSYGPERVVAEASAERRSLLVLTDVHFPGWKATVDGKSVPIERVDYLLRGVVVPPGTHRVEFSYEPASFRAGWIISVLGLLSVLGAAVVGLRRRRRS
jgi:Bacterial membrane protein YfhO